MRLDHGLGLRLQNISCLRSEETTEERCQKPGKGGMTYDDDRQLPEANEKDRLP